MLVLFVQIASFTIVSAIFWRLVRSFVIKSELSEIPGPPSSSLWSGNFFQLFDRHAWGFHAHLAKKYGAAVRVRAFLGDQQLYTFDPLALTNIFIKHSYSYEETDSFIALNDAVYGPSLPSTVGNAHRRQRKMLHPAFQPKHLRSIMPLFYPIAHQLRDVLSKQAREGRKDIDVMAWISRAALECVGQGGIGYSFDALDENKVNRYNEAVKMLIPLGANLQIVQQLLPYAYKLVTPGWLRRKLFVDINPSKHLRRVRDIVDIMDETSRDIFEKKKAALAQGESAIASLSGQGKDIMTVMIKANTEAEEKEKLQESELLGQMNAFIFAGHDSTTSAVSRILHQLALNPHIQERLRKEVTDARAANGDINFEELNALPFLDAVVKETLRVYPPVANVFRVVKEDIVLPLTWPIKSVDGKNDITSIPLKKNTKIIASIFNANRCTRIWGPDAEEWKPERWLNPMPESVTEARLPGIYSSMMTFTGGGRSCIGFKFAEMEIKLILSVILESLVFTPGSQESYWNMSATYSPTVKGSADISPRLLLNVSAV